MHIFRILLLAVLFVLGVSHAAAKSVHTCCAGSDCAITQCVDMGCAPAAVPPLASVQGSAIPVSPQRAPFPAWQDPAPRMVAEEIWTPPD